MLELMGYEINTQHIEWGRHMVETMTEEPQAIELPNGTKLLYRYDPCGQLIRVVAERNGTRTQPRQVRRHEAQEKLPDLISEVLFTLDLHDA